MGPSFRFSVAQDVNSEREAVRFAVAAWNTRHEPDGVAEKDAEIERLKKRAAAKTRDQWDNFFGLIEPHMREDESLRQCAKRLLTARPTCEQVCEAVETEILNWLNTALEADTISIHPDDAIKAVGKGARQAFAAKEKTQ
jgi:hypothetical protein